MMHEILEAPGLKQELTSRLRRLEVRTTRIFGQALPEAASAYAMASVYLDQLTGRAGIDAAVAVAHVLQDDLIDAPELGTSVFWSSPLGRAVGYWTGGLERQLDAHGSVGVPQVEAAALLGMSRQGVNDAIKRKRLVAVANGVTALSVADYMHQRYPLERAA